MSLDRFYQTCGVPKGEPRKRRKAREARLEGDEHAAIRVYVFGREEGICRCCRIRAAESRHERISRGRRGGITKKNCIAVCGTIVGAVPSCHTYLQLNQIEERATTAGAEGLLEFRPLTRAAADWMRVPIGQWVASLPGSRNDELEAC